MTTKVQSVQPPSNLIRSVGICAVLGVVLSVIGHYALARDMLAGFGYALMGAAVLAVAAITIFAAALDRRSWGARHFFVISGLAGCCMAAAASGWYMAERTVGQITTEHLNHITARDPNVARGPIPAEISACLERKDDLSIAERARNCLVEHQDTLNYASAVTMINVAYLADHFSNNVGGTPASTEYKKVAKSVFNRHVLACKNDSELTRVVATAQFSTTRLFATKTFHDSVAYYDPTQHALRGADPELASETDAVLRRSKAAWN